MERVVTINLNGNPYQLEEPAYDAVRAYLKNAETALADDPDKAEVIRDLEQAVADKCASYLSPVKSIVTASEMTKILDEMGPVEGGAAEGAQTGDGATGSGTTRHRKLYRIKDGAQIAGVCAGLSAYFDIDANWMRVLFLLATVLTSGFFILVYIGMMFIIPSANTSEEWAAAHGVPFNAQEVIDRAKREYQNFAPNGPPWSSKWQYRAWRREMKDRMRGWRRSWRYGPPPNAPPPAAGPISAFGGFLAGLLMIVFTGVRVALGLAFFIVIVTLATTGAVFGWPLPDNVPLWQAILIVILAYVVISIPLRAIMWGLRGDYYGYHGGSGLLGIAMVILFAWLAYTYIPEARDFMDHIPDALHRLGDALRDAFETTTTHTALPPPEPAPAPTTP
jgi:phage shock protein PspC (stress-responsive transcriptional regulator)